MLLRKKNTLFIDQSAFSNFVVYVIRASYVITVIGRSNYPGFGFSIATLSCENFIAQLVRSLNRNREVTNRESFVHTSIA